MAKRFPKNYIYAIVILIPLVIFLLRPAFLNEHKSTVVDATSWPRQLLHWPFEEIKKIVFYHQTYDLYLKYKNEAQTLRAKLVNANEIIHENKRLESLLEFKKQIPYESVAASVIGRDPSNWNAVVIINKGRGAGIKIGMPVVNAAGVVGKVVEVGKNNSKLILVSDPNFHVAAIAQTSRESGLLSGTLQGICRLRYLSIDSEITEGEAIVTSKLSSTFPDGILIGTVIRIQKPMNSAGIECMVKPVVDPSTIEEVLVLKK